MEKIKSSNLDKYAYTVIMCLNQAGFGMTFSMFGLVLVDMKHILNTSTNLISLFSTFITVGFLVGSFFGFLYKWLNRQITSAIFLMMLSISSFLIPYSPGLWALYICGFVKGLGIGVWTAVVNVWLMEMWRKNSASILQLLQFMFGVGTILSPLVTKPYLTGEYNNHPNETEYSTSSGVILPTVNSTIIEDNIDRRSKLKIPYLICGSIQISFPILLMLMFVIKRYKIPERNSILKKNKSNSDVKLFDRKESPRKLVIALMAMCMSTYNASEATFLQFESTYYQYSTIHLTASKAAEVISAKATAYTIGRGISIFVAIKIKPQHMIAYHLSISIIGIVILIFAQNAITLVWIASATVGFGFSAMFPAIFAFLRQYIEMTNTIGTILTFASSSLNLFSPFILGTFIEKHSIAFIIIEMTYLSISSILFCIILNIIRKTSKSIKTLVDNRVYVLN